MLDYEPIVRTISEAQYLPDWLMARWGNSDISRYFINKITTSIDVPEERTTLDLITTVEYKEQCCKRKGCEVHHRLETKCCRTKARCTCIRDSLICYVRIHLFYSEGVINNIRRRKYAKILALCDGKYEKEEDFRITEFFEHNDREYQLTLRKNTPKLSKVDSLIIENEVMKSRIELLENEIERLRKEARKAQKREDKLRRRIYKGPE
jgi:hypothetical protein